MKPKYLHIYWTDPISGLRLMAARIPRKATAFAKDRALDETRKSIFARHGAEAAASVSWTYGEPFVLSPPEPLWATDEEYQREWDRNPLGAVTERHSVHWRHLTDAQ